jgi:hypothetical protein
MYSYCHAKYLRTFKKFDLSTLSVILGGNVLGLQAIPILDCH